MTAVVVYESMYGNTRAIAEAIGDGLTSRGLDATVVHVAAVDANLLASSRLIVVGGPTHAFGMSRPSTRKSAAEPARLQRDGLTLEAQAGGPGLREWLSQLAAGGAQAAVFDTRVEMPGIVGHASRGITRKLRSRGFDVIDRANSFFVTKTDELRPGEAVRARVWGCHLADLMAAKPSRTP